MPSHRLPVRAALRAMAVLACCMIAAPILTAAPARAAPALWEVKSDTATVYLFGTVHRLPPGVQWHSPTIDRAVASSEEVWTEAEPGNMPSLVRLIRRYGLNPGSNLRNILPPRYRDRYDFEMRTAGLASGQFGHVKPWLAEMLLTGATMHRNTGLSVDIDLLAYAHKHHLKTQTFETADQQFSILADLPIASQVRALELQIEGFPSAQGKMNGLVQSWLDGDERRLDSLSNRPLAEQDERYFTDVIVRRNENFAQAIATRLAGSGTAFVAIGAAHLCGTADVQYFLKNYGFEATRVAEPRV